MSDVSCRVFAFFERAADIHGFPVEELVGGLSTSLDDLRDPSRRCPWEDWAELCERLETRVGAEALEALGAEMGDLPFSRSFLVVTRTVVPLPQLYRAITDWLAPLLFRHAEFTTTVHSSHRVTITISIPPHRRGSAAWMRVAAGSLTSVPTLVGQGAPRAHVTLTPHRTEVELTFEAARSALTQKVVERVRFALAPGAVLDDLAAMQAELRGAFTDLAARERDLRAVLGHLPVPLLVHADGEVSFVNEAFLAQVQVTPPTRVEGLLGEVCPHQARTVEVPGPKAEPRWFEVSAPVPLVYEGRPSQLLVLRDVTDERREAERLAVTNRLTALGTLAACVGHELNNPLAFALSSLELLREELDRPATPEQRAAARELIDGAVDGLERASIIGRDLHAFAKPRLDKASPVDLPACLDLVLRMAQGQLRHVGSVTREEEEDLPTVLAEERCLGQVILNLILNAAQAMADEPNPRLTLRTTRAGEDDVQLEVIDNGVGIPADQVARIFEPFYTTKGAEGTGLGLAVCKRLMEEQGGRIEVESRVGEGTTFRLHLSVAEARPRRSIPPVLGDGLSEVRVLVIDDEPALGRLIARMLAPRQVVVRDCARDALELLRGASFDLILCDLMMPDMPGAKLHEHLATIRPDLAERMVFMTGGAYTDESADFLARCEHPPLLKPFRRAQLLAAVDTLLGGSAEEGFAPSTAS